MCVRAMVARLSTTAGVYKLDAANREVPINPHMLRHSYATRLVANGTPIHDVQSALGHANLATTQRYLHVNPEERDRRILAAWTRAVRTTSSASWSNRSGPPCNIGRAMPDPDPEAILGALHRERSQRRRSPLDQLRYMADFARSESVRVQAAKALVDRHARARPS